MKGRTNAGGSSVQIPLEAPTALTATAGNAKVSLTWTDPVDKYATPEGEQAQDPQQLVSVWAYTKIVRKAGGAPTGPNDGVAVVSSEVRNAYQTEPFVDTGVENDVTYYYGAFAYNEDFVVSKGAFSEGVTPKAYDPVLNNNTWAQIDAVCTEGIAPSVWEIGDEKDITVLDGETVTVVILDFDHDDLADSSGKAAISFGMKNLLATTRRIASDNRYGVLPFNSTELYSWINNTLYPSIQEDCKTYIRSVSKTSYTVDFDSREPASRASTYSCFAFLFSVTEIGLTVSDGKSYSTVYPYYSTASKRIKKLANGAGNASSWSTRDLENDNNRGMYYYTSGYCVGANGTLLSRDGNDSSPSNVKNQFGVCFGFCVGKSAA